MILYITIAALVVGVLFLLTETFIPGFGFFGFSGIMLIILSVILTIVSIPNGIFIALAELASLIIIGSLIFRYIKNKQLYGKIILQDEGSKPQEDLIGGREFFLGKEGITKTPLKPFGMAEFNGVSIEVSSDSVFIKEKTRIKVVDVSSNKIIVKPLLAENSN